MYLRTVSFDFRVEESEPAVAGIAYTAPGGTAERYVYGDKQTCIFVTVKLMHFTVN